MTQLYNVLRERLTVSPGQQTHLGEQVYQQQWQIVHQILAEDGSAALAEAKRQGFLAPVIAPARQQPSKTPS